MHAPSEHTFDGKFYDLEFHFVHKSYEENRLAVIAVYFDVEDGGDKPNDFIASLNLNDAKPTVKYYPLMQLFNSLDSSKFYHYKGSLTTPPCSEIVNWLVVNDP
jgi:carbonic anhydrase